jgi:hypothetical protein
MRTSLLATSLVLWIVLTGKVTLSDGPVQGDASSVSADELLRKAVDHELRADKEDQSHWMYKSTTSRSGRAVTKEVIETKQGDLDRLLSINGKAISEEQQKSESKRLQKLVADPQELRKLQKNQQNDSDQSEHLLAVLPKAMIASYGHRRNGLIELNLEPNPKYHPTSHETAVFHAMAGKVWVNDKEDWLAEIDGHLIKRVEFWHGLLGHLEKGGQFHVVQSEVQPGHWEITALNVNMRGKALFFKNIGAQENETRSDFQKVPDDLTLAQAAEKLEPRTEAAER